MDDAVLSNADLTARMLAQQGLIDFLLMGAHLSQPGLLERQRDILESLAARTTDPLFHQALVHQIEAIERTLDE